MTDESALQPELEMTPSFGLSEVEDAIITTFIDLLPEKKEEWQLLGVVNRKGDIFPLGQDSKIIGRIFEIVATAYVQKLAEKLQCTFIESPNQTTYPDFILQKQDGRKIAIDVKTTYRNITASGAVSKFKFTLGSFTSFLRNGTKNIEGNYSDYDSHYVLAFLYTRSSAPHNPPTKLSKLSSIEPTYGDVEVAFVEKYRIAGDKPGSGNTDNIATIQTNSMEPIQLGAGPFATLGNAVFEHYWRHYPRNADPVAIKDRLYRNLPSYFDWLEKDTGNNDANFDVDDLRQKYSNYKEWVKEQEWKITLY